MTAAAPLVFPGSRTVAGWWKQLDPLQPRSLWLGGIVLHQVEALVRVQAFSALDPLTAQVLRRSQGQVSVTPRQLGSSMHLDPALVARILRGAQAEGLVIAKGTESWSLGPAGETGLASGAAIRTGFERRRFEFAHSSSSQAAPQFVRLLESKTLAGAALHEGSLNPAVLAESIGLDPDWKSRHQFPQDVLELVPMTTGSSSDDSPPAWRRIIVNRAVRLFALLALLDDGCVPPALHAFAVQPENWVLPGLRPCFVIPDDGQRAFPELTPDQDTEHARNAWSAWCRSAALPAEAARSCVVDVDSSQVRVRAPRALAERIWATRGEVQRGEAWLLLGTGSLRRAVQLAVTVAESS